VQRRSPHLLQRSRRVTSSSLASQPQTLASDLGSIRRSCPQAAHFKISSYCPNSSESFSTLNARRIPLTLAPVGCEYPQDNSYSIRRTGQLYNHDDSMELRTVADAYLPPETLVADIGGTGGTRPARAK
jgi:hypothetical protein